MYFFNHILFRSVMLLVILHYYGLRYSPVLAALPRKEKPRIIITADPELDDNNSLIRFLLYSADFRVEGLVYASSQFHWRGDGKGTKFMVPGREYTKYGLNLCPCTSYRWKQDERFIHEAVDAYAQVYSNLVRHDRDYPNPDQLRSKIRYGNIDFEGDFSKDTEGSDLIKAAILDNVPGPLFITAWGGQSTIARALKSIEEEYANSRQWERIYKKVSKKVVILPSGDQDNTYASYIRVRWPQIDYRQYRNGPNYGYGAQLVASSENAGYLTAEWMKANITSKGPLGEIYRVWGDGKQMVKGDVFDYFGMSGYTNEQLRQMGYIVWMPVQTQGSWLGEGDTGTFMNLLSNGLDAWMKDAPGGWGGRPFYPDYKEYVDPFSNDTTRGKKKDLVISAATLQELSPGEAYQLPFPDFFRAAQNDFAARMRWSMEPNVFAANHPPVIEIKGRQEISAYPGQKLSITGSINDPDLNAYSIRWWQFRQRENEPRVIFFNEQAVQTHLDIPKDALSGQVIHVVLEVTDQGQPALTRYRVLRIRIK